MEAEAGTSRAGGAAALTGTFTVMGSEGSEAHFAQLSSFHYPASGHSAWGKEDIFSLPLSLWQLPCSQDIP